MIGPLVVFAFMLIGFCWGVLLPPDEPFNDRKDDE